MYEIYMVAGHHILGNIGQLSLKDRKQIKWAPCLPQFTAFRAFPVCGAERGPQAEPSRPPDLGRCN